MEEFEMDVKFRIATIDDVEKIVELCNECFEENTSLEYATKSFKETENNKDHIYIVGELGDKVVAHSKITVIPTMYEKMNTYAILNHVCVKPVYRRQNIGTKMLVECEKICKEHGCVVMELWSNNYRIAAHACYKNYGFIVNDASFFSKEI